MTSTSCYKLALLTYQSVLYSCTFSTFAFISCLTSTHHTYFSRDDVTTRPVSASTPFHTTHTLTVTSYLPLASCTASTYVHLIVPKSPSPTSNQPLSFTGLCRTKTLQAAQVKLSSSLHSRSRLDGTSTSSTPPPSLHTFFF